MIETPIYRMNVGDDAIEVWQCEDGSFRFRITEAASHPHRQKANIRLDPLRVRMLVTTLENRTPRL